MTGKIKVALCLSGEPRSSMFCFSYIYESLLQENPYFEVDTYIHSWKPFRALPLYSPKSTKLEPYIPQIIEENIRKNLPIQYYTNNKIHNYFKMYYAIKTNFNQVPQPYDIYIRCRLDLIFESKLVLYPIFLDILNKKYNLISLHSNYPTKIENGIDDQFLICDFKSSQILSNYYDFITSPNNFVKNLCPNLEEFHPEQLLKKYLDSKDINILNIPLSNYNLVRYSGVTTADPYFNFLDQ